MMSCFVIVCQFFSCYVYIREKPIKESLWKSLYWSPRHGWYIKTVRLIIFSLCKAPVTGCLFVWKEENLMCVNKKQKQADFIQVMRAKQNEKFAKGLAVDNRIVEISRKAP